MIERQLLTMRRIGTRPVVYHDALGRRWSYAPMDTPLACQRCGVKAVRRFVLHPAGAAKPRRSGLGYCEGCVILDAGRPRPGPHAPTPETDAAGAPIARCARCRRPLRDARALEAGRGHVCRGAEVQVDLGLEVPRRRLPR